MKVKHVHTYLSCTGHCIIFSSLSIVPTFLIFVLDQKSTFQGAAACLMQFRLGGRAAPQQVTAETSLPKYKAESFVTFAKEDGIYQIVFEQNNWESYTWI